MDKLGAKKRIGILGGTFNPVHFGHLAIAAAAFEQACLDQIIFIPAHVPPHKNKKEIIDSGLRYEMLLRAISNNSNFSVSDIEIRKKEISYSIETLNVFKEKYPDSELFFIIGSDTVSELKTWRLIDQIFELCCFIIAMRPNFEDFDTADLPKNSIVLKGLYPDISSTFIRNQIRQGLAVDDLLPETVIKFIEQNELYR